MKIKVRDEVVVPGRKREKRRWFARKRREVREEMVAPGRKREVRDEMVVPGREK